MTVGVCIFPDPVAPTAQAYKRTYQDLRRWYALYGVHNKYALDQQWLRLCAYWSGSTDHGFLQQESLLFSEATKGAAKCLVH